MHHNPQAPILVCQEHHLGVMSTVRVFSRLLYHRPAARTHLPEGRRLGEALRSVKDDESSVLGSRDPIFHHQQLEVHHEVDMKAGEAVQGIVGVRTVSYFGQKKVVWSPSL